MIVQKATQEKALITAKPVPPEEDAGNERRRRCLIAQKGTQEKDPRRNKKIPSKQNKNKEIKAEQEEYNKKAKPTHTLGKGNGDVEKATGAGVQRN